VRARRFAVVDVVHPRDLECERMQRITDKDPVVDRTEESGTVMIREWAWPGTMIGAEMYQVRKWFTEWARGRISMISQTPSNSAAR
jgi:hypothetical protein